MANANKNRLSLKSAVTIGALVAATFGARAAGQSDPYAVDVLGFHLGMPLDDVRKAVADKFGTGNIQVRQGTLTLGSYKSGQLLFGVRASNGKDSHLNNEADAEYLYFVFGQKSPFPLLHIRRVRTFSKDQAPLLAQFTASMADKYGPPRDENKQPIMDEARWTYGSQVTSSYRDLRSVTCSYALFETGFAGSLYGGSFPNPPDPTLAQCGAWMDAKLWPLPGNGALVGKIEIAIGDLKALRDSDLYLYGVLSAGAADVTGNQNKKALYNNAPL